MTVNNKITMKHHFLLLCLIYVFLSTSAKLRSEVPLKPITIIFDSIKSNYDTLYFRDGGSRISIGDVLTIRASANEHRRLILKDTVEIEPKENYVVLKHRYNPVSSVEFLLKAGDAAKITYIDGIPFVTIGDRPMKHFDVNYDYFRRLRYSLYENMQTTEIVNDPSLLVYKRLLKGIRATVPKIREEFEPVMLRELEDESRWLDSILDAKQISETEYRFYKERNKYNSLNVKLNYISSKDLIGQLNEYNDSVYKNDVAGFYRNYFYSVGIRYLKEIKNTFSNNKETLLYDHVVQDSYLQGRLLQDLKLKCVIDIIHATPAAVRRSYVDKFAGTVADTALVSRLKRHYSSLLDPQITSATDLELLDINGQKTTLSKILSQSKGKAVYVDFWASWCAPCLREMPISKELRQNEKYKNIVFVYLAINDNQEQWKNASKKVALDDYSHNYLILNSRDANFVKENKISSIPRHMLFDKQGNLINPNAPGPGDINIHRTLTGN